jgi:YD repeat-containing protein
MRQITLFMLFLAPAFCLGADRFLLDSELRTNLADNGSTTQFLTGYTYDASGNRVQSRVWSGTDSTASPMSIDKFTYDANGNITQEILLSGSDTSAIVQYAYAGGKPIAVRTLAKDGTLRFTDSLLYDGQGRNVEEQRIVSGVITYFHRYTLNGSGKMLADSLYELDSSTYVAEQADLFTYNTDSTAATQAHWQVSGGSWYCISTAFMSYGSGSLVSVATYERDGAGTAMTDSLAYAYDANGNRTGEEDYDGTQTLIYRIVYAWRDMQPTITLLNGKSRGDQAFVLNDRQGRLSVDCASRNRGEISIYDMTGKRLCRIAVDHSGIVPLQGLIGKGSFIAVFTGGINKQIMNFINY